MTQFLGVHSKLNLAGKQHQKVVQCENYDNWTAVA